ncbi:TolC family protein [Erythrobacter sp.]|uniref:TolC family protein n=1 Tax=Erythrobacter sp. TaxID=1042 RepID=UPI00311E8436
MKWQVGGALLAALLAAPHAQAQPVSFDDALHAARHNQPMLDAGALRVAGKREAIAASDELPDPRLRAGIANLPVSGPVAFELDRQLPTQVSLGVEQEFPNLAKRRARYGLAASEVRLAEARLGLAERSVEIATGMAWVELHYAQRKLDLARAALEDLRKLVPVANSAVASGSARPAHSLALRKDLLGVEDAITSIEVERDAAQAMLARYIAVIDPIAEGAAPEAAIDAGSLKQMLDLNPELKFADAAVEGAEAGVRLARAEKRPDFGVSVNYGRRDDAFGDVVSVMGSVTLPIFAGRRQEPRIAAAEAEAAAASAEREDRVRALEARLEADLAQWRGADHQWRRAREELLPLARERAELETASFAAGRASLFDVVTAKSALLLLELDILEREAATVSAAVRLKLGYGEDGL